MRHRIMPRDRWSMEIAAASDILPYLCPIAVIAAARPGGRVLSLPGMATVALLTDRVCIGAGSRPHCAEVRCIDDKRPKVFARQDLQVTRIRAIRLTMRNGCPIC